MNKTEEKEEEPPMVRPILHKNVWGGDDTEEIAPPSVTTPEGTIGFLQSD